MTVAELNVGRVRRRRGSLLIDGSNDLSRWKLLSTANIQATTDTNGLETSKSMSGKEIQFRGSVPGGASDFHPDNGVMHMELIKLFQRRPTQDRLETLI